MARANFREVQSRFTHIDAELVECSCTLKSADSRYVVRFYPWWEHPAYLSAIKDDSPWGFSNTKDGAKNVTVWPINPVAFHLSLRHEVIEWDFCEVHPVLWDYEDEGEIVANGDFDKTALINTLLTQKTPYLTRATLLQYLDPLHEYKAPYSLGHFPFTLFHLIRKELERRKIPIFIPREPEERHKPVLLLIDGDDYIVANDFELEVPEFEHLPEWFQPTLATQDY